VQRIEEFSSMRTILARLALAGVFGIALNGCGGSSGTSLPTGGLPNGAGGGSVQSSNGVGPPPPGTEPALAVDGGAAPGYAGTLPYKQVLPTTATDVVVPGVPSAPSPAPLGSHTITYTSSALTQVVGYSGTAPNLTYQFGITGNIATFNYNEIDIVGATYTGTPVPATIAVELTNGNAALDYDVRLICGGPALSATPTTYRCLFPTNGITFAPSPAPPYYIANSYGAPSGSYTTKYTAGVSPAPATYTRPTGPGAPSATLYPTDAGTFTPIAPSVYVVITFSAPNVAGGVLSFVGLEAIQ
jgi:hypothetical protein